MSRYNPVVSVFSTDALTFLNPIPSISLVIPGTLPAPTMTYTQSGFLQTMSAPYQLGGARKKIAKNDGIFVKRFAVFCNFADGIVPVEPGASAAFSLFLSADQTQNPAINPNTVVLPFSAFNTWNEYNQRVSAGNVPTPEYFLSASLASFVFRVDSIDSTYNNEKATFRAFVEVEHTFDLLP